MSGLRYVFLDRDGTLVADDGYVSRVEDFALLPGVIEGLTRLTAAGYRLAIVTNQSGIGRGYFTEAAFQRFQGHLIETLRGHDIAIDATFFCPHHPDDGCPCRKPGTAMLERAERELGASLAESWVIGDSAVDVELAARAGCKAVRVGRPGSRTACDAAPAGDDRSLDAAGVREAVDLILAPRAPS